MTSKEAVLELICEAKSVNIDERRVCFLRKIIEKDLDLLEEYRKIEEERGCPLDIVFKALKGFYTEFGYISNEDDFIYLRKDDKGYYLKVAIHPSKPTPPHFYGYCDIHYLKDYKKTWFLKEDRSE